MKRYKVTIPIIGVETHYIEANSPEEALEKIQNEDYEGDYATEIQDTDYDNAEIIEE